MTTKPKAEHEGPRYNTSHGRMYCGPSEDILRTRTVKRRRGRTQLIFTSPPFPLNRKKRYGNLTGTKYIEWLSGYAGLFRDYLKEDGSIVVEIGNAWEKGKPVMSTLPMEALLAFKEAGDLNLCQEFICFNPARLPSPAQWVNVERSRVKDAFTRVWWMAPSERPKADNRRVLTQYSGSMRQLLERGTYNAGTRPSQHSIGSKSFLSNHGGAIPPNVVIPPIDELLDEVMEVLPIANTSSNDNYRTYCLEHGLEQHPARMPAQLAEFFILLTTDSRDLVLDPFAGSNLTGSVAQRLNRRWLSIEANDEYVEGSRGRFPTG